MSENEKKSKSIALRVFMIISIVIIIAGIIVATNVVANTDFEVSFYSVKSQGVADNIRIIELSDLHNIEYGKDNSRLVNKIESLHPDLIFYSGDMLNYGDDNYSVLYNLSDKLSTIAPIYACFGNNELQQYLARDRKLKDKMGEHGVTWLSNESMEIEVRNTKIQLIAVTEAVKQYDVKTNNAKKFVESLEPTDDLRICLCHYPEMFNKNLLNKGIDIAFTGHAHGGLIRIPYVGGIISPGQGLFPKFTQGVKTMEDGTMVVISRGLGQSGHTVRINNKPELVVVDLCWY